MLLLAVWEICRNVATPWLLGYWQAAPKTTRINKGEYISGHKRGQAPTLSPRRSRPFNFRPRKPRSFHSFFLFQTFLSLLSFTRN
jgi:hypothetical protein